MLYSKNNSNKALPLVQWIIFNPLGLYIIFEHPERTFKDAAWEGLHMIIYSTTALVAIIFSNLPSLYPFEMILLYINIRQ